MFKDTKSKGIQFLKEFGVDPIDVQKIFYLNCNKSYFYELNKDAILFRLCDSLDERFEALINYYDSLDLVFDVDYRIIIANFDVFVIPINGVELKKHDLDLNEIIRCEIINYIPISSDDENYKIRFLGEKK